MRLLVALQTDAAILGAGEIPQKPRTTHCLCPKDSVSCFKGNSSTMFTIASKWKRSKCPSSGEWIRKIWYIVGPENYSAVKRSEVMKYADK